MTKHNNLIKCFIVSVMTILLILGCQTIETSPILQIVVSDTAPAFLTVKVESDDVNIGYLGRIDFQDPKSPAFSFPAVTITAGFKGTGIGIILTDSGNRNYYNVFIDDEEAMVLRTTRGTKFYTIAQNLKNTDHTIMVYKRTESNCGKTSFGGFGLNKGAFLTSKPEEPVRKIEFIGDSITCGYGNMISTDSPGDFPFTPENENSYLSWGAITARALGASFILTSYSGRGMFRNYDGSETGTLPKIFNSIFPDYSNGAKWDTSRYIPDIVVINLGTNDYSSQLSRHDLTQEELDNKFIEAYTLFIENLREVYGSDVNIICCVGPMMSDSYPPKTSSWTRIQNCVSSIVENYNDNNDPNVYYLKLNPQQSPYGEDWHPTVATHRQMADALLPVIRSITGW